MVKPDISGKGNGSELRASTKDDRLSQLPIGDS